MLFYLHFKVAHQLSEPLGDLVLQEEAHVAGRYEALQLNELWSCGNPRLNTFV